MILNSWYIRYMDQPQFPPAMADLMPMSRAAARFGYRDPRYFRRHAAKQRYGLTVIKFNGRYFISAAEIDAFWLKHREALQAVNPSDTQ